MGTAGNDEIAGNYGNSRGIMQPGIAAAHGTVGAVWSGIGWSGRRPKPGTRRSLICIRHNPSTPPSFSTLTEFLFGFALLMVL